MKTTLALLAVFALLLATACNSTKDSMTSQPSAQAAINTTCPISDEPVAAGVTVDYDGSTIGFCCNNCVTKFNEKTEAEKSSMLASLKSKM